MSRLVEISPDGLGSVRGDVAATRDCIRDELGPLQWRMSNLDVPTGALHEALAVGNRLDTVVLPTLDWHVSRARELDTLRYHGSMGPVLPVVDRDDPVGPPAAAFTQQPWDDGTTALTWAAAPAAAHEADKAATEKSNPISSWFGDRWDDVTQAVDDGVDWLTDTATDAWDQILETGGQISDWWEKTTADLGGWIDENLADLREFIGRNVAVFRVLATVCRIVGWVVVAIGAVLTVVLAVVGATGGSAFGAVFGLGVGAVPGGAAGALAGASTGLKILGVGFALVSVGDFLDVAADWGEGKIDGQDLVKQGSLEAVFALTSLVGFGAIGKIAQKLLQHVPESWLKRLDDLLQRPTGHRVPASDKEMLQPLHSGSPLGPGWKRQPDIEPDDLYGQSRPDFGALNTKNQVPSTIDPDIRRLGGDLSNPWGIDPDTGLAFTEAEWLRRFTTGSGDVRWPPNRGAVPGTRVEFYDADRFLQTYGDQFDRVGNDRGSFLGVPPGATFGERSLPPSTLKDPLSHYTFDTLPPGMTIEVSEIAPAFGRPGGALQVRFMDNGKPVSVAELIKRGVLT